MIGLVGCEVRAWAMAGSRLILSRQGQDGSADGLDIPVGHPGTGMANTRWTPSLDRRSLFHRSRWLRSLGRTSKDRPF